MQGAVEAARRSLAFSGAASRTFSGGVNAGISLLAHYWRTGERSALSER